MFLAFGADVAEIEETNKMKELFRRLWGFAKIGKRQEIIDRWNLGDPGISVGLSGKGRRNISRG